MAGNEGDYFDLYSRVKSIVAGNEGRIILIYIQGSNPSWRETREGLFWSVFKDKIHHGGNEGRIIFVYIQG